MPINRGYIANHKASGGGRMSVEADKRILNYFEVECPNCKSKLTFPGLYEEYLSSVITCPKCNLEASGFTYTFISSFKREVK